MRSSLVALVAFLILAVLVYFAYSSTSTFLKKTEPSPTPTASIEPSPTPTPTPQSKPTPVPATPYESVKGASTTQTTTKTTTTTTTSHLKLTLVKTSACPISYMTEIKDIDGPLTLKYSLKDGYSFGLTIWRDDGNELLSNTTYSGTSGTIKTISGVKYMKLRIESKTCSATSENWLTLTAER